MDDKEILGNIEEILENFVIDLHEKLDIHDFEDVIKGNKSDLVSQDLRQSPESYTEQALIWPILDELRHEKVVRPFAEGGGRGEWPDFRIDGLNKEIIGENKPINNIKSAEVDVKDYLDRKSIPSEYGIATDGFTWVIYKIEISSDFTEFPVIEKFNLRPLILDIAHKKGYLPETQLDNESREDNISNFVDAFESHKLDKLTSEEAPKRLKERKKKDIEDFYDLYIELLFGEGKKDYNYETTLVESIESPKTASDKDIRVFGITLVNRLLFIKFLEKKGVIPGEVLIQRVDNYEQSKELLVDNLYDAQIKPLFYDLFNTPLDERNPKHRQDWFGEIPYLNGGLFRKNIENESQFSIHDEMLKTIIEDLIEGHKLDKSGEFDPAVIGSVFEKTITYIEHEREQKDLGAYYTPNEVTKLISDTTIDPKIKDKIIETIGSNNQNEKIINYLENTDISQLFRYIEEGRVIAILLPNDEEIEIDFGDEEVLEELLSSLKTIKILDPACGSGHFLTTALEEVQKAQISILRGLDEHNGRRAFEEKKKTALNVIYGVDVDPIATEIAKLRVWLKIIEDGWEPDYGKLPNIDVNISAGNSLIGFPFTGEGQAALTLTDDGIQDLKEYRRLYKEGNAQYKQKIVDLEASIRQGLNSEYLQHYNAYIKDDFESCEQFQNFINNTSSGIFNSIKSIKIKKEDNSRLTEGEKKYLDNLGYKNAQKSARIPIDKRKSSLSLESDRESKFIDECLDVLDNDFKITEIERKPTKYDLNNVLGSSFHWNLEFPETGLESSSGRHKAKFDVIIGNPPYGNILGAPEKMLTSNYRTSDVKDIAAPFLERQLQLLKEGGYFGNITTLRMIYQSDLKEVHDLLHEKLDNTKIACFAHRPQQVFDNAIVRVGIMTGKKSTSERSSIQTSELINLHDGEREKLFDNISYEKVDNLYLREKIGGSDRAYEIMPKVGNNNIKSILKKLSSKNRTIGDVESKQETDYPAFRKRGGGYWVGYYNQHPYKEDRSSIKKMFYSSQLEKDTAFLIVNSNLFYLYWLTYSNFRNFDKGMIRRFPFPGENKMKQNSDAIQKYASQLWEEMDKYSSQDKRYDIRTIDMSKVKPKIDEIEKELMSSLYGLSDEQIEFLNNYKNEVRLSN